MTPSKVGKCKKKNHKVHSLLQTDPPTMPAFPWTTLSLLVLVSTRIPPSSAQFFLTSDTPGPVSQLLQLVWEPSSLIRMWTALDQMHNILRGWRSAAEKVVQLPFRQGRGMDDHVRIQVPRRYSRMQQKHSSDMPHWDWFKKVYEESSPQETGNDNVQMSGQHSMINNLVENGNFLLHSMNGLKGNEYNSLNVPVENTNVLQRFLSSFKGANVRFGMNEPFSNFDYLQQSSNVVEGNGPYSINDPITNGDFLQSLNALSNHQHLKVPKVMPLPHLLNPGGFQTGAQNKMPYLFQPQEAFVDHNMVEFPNKNGEFRRSVNVPSRKIVRKDTVNGQLIRPFNSNVPSMFFNGNGVPVSNPETRLRMFLKLMGQLGEMHKKSAQPVEFDDDPSDDLVNE